MPDPAATQPAATAHEELVAANREATDGLVDGPRVRIHFGGGRKMAIAGVVIEDASGHRWLESNWKHKYDLEGTEPIEKIEVKDADSGRYRDR